MFDGLLFTASVGVGEIPAPGNGKAEHMAPNTEQMRLPARYESQVLTAPGGGPHPLQAP